MSSRVPWRQYDALAGALRFRHRETHATPAHTWAVRDLFEQLVLLDVVCSVAPGGFEALSPAGDVIGSLLKDQRPSRAEICSTAWRAALAQYLPRPLLDVASSDEASGPAAWTIDVAVLQAATRELTAARKSFDSRDVCHWMAMVHETLLGLGPRSKGSRLVDSPKHDVKQTLGAYYTPPAVVRYLVDKVLNTARGRPPARLLDPACGCGPMLIEAGRRLAQADRALPLRTEARDTIRVLQHLRGIDIEPGAVLITRRCLWLEALTGWSRGQAFVGSASPLDPLDPTLARLLAENIVCADALRFDCEKAWHGPIEAVVGNPPYRKERYHGDAMARLAEASSVGHHRAARMDLWYYFVHSALQWLAPGGRLAFIIGSYWTAGAGSRRLIEHLREDAHLEELFLLEKTRVFPRVSGRHMILSLAKRSVAAEPTPTRIKRVSPCLFRAGGRPSIEAVLENNAALLTYEKSHDDLFTSDGLDLDPTEPGLPLEKRPHMVPLGQFGVVRQGIVENPAQITRRLREQWGDSFCIGEGVFSLTPEELNRLELSPDERRLTRPYHDLADVGRYRIADTASRVLIHTTAETCPDIQRFPKLRRHLERFRPMLEARRETRLGRRAWWQLHWPREARLWESPKLIIPQMAARPGVAPTSRAVYVPFSVNVFVPHADTPEHLGYLTAVLNSRHLANWFRRRAKHRGIGLDLSVAVLNSAPIRRIQWHIPREREIHEQLARLVRQRLLLTAESASAEAAQMLEDSIDALVDELYT